MGALEGRDPGDEHVEVASFAGRIGDPRLEDALDNLKRVLSDLRDRHGIRHIGTFIYTDPKGRQGCVRSIDIDREDLGCAQRAISRLLREAQGSNESARKQS